MMYIMLVIARPLFQTNFDQFSNVDMLSVIMMNVIMLSVVMLKVIMLSVVAPSKYSFWISIGIFFSNSFY
jgi:hypothetical protein